MASKKVNRLSMGQATMSKRAQARTEGELRDLLNVPGNATCADCGAPNPTWASWNLGVFLCMRCASIHRKLGTHISKVKSLSMDTWSNDQAMKKNGNIASNRLYNPKNKKPDMPLDADEVDSAMERFIRKKYQEKSLSDGRPEVPSRDERSLPRSRSPDIPASPIQPSKRKSKFFSLALRSHDKKNRNETRAASAFPATSDSYNSVSRSSSSRKEVSDQDLQVRLAQLRDMGFADNDRNLEVLKRHNGDLESSVAALLKSLPSEPSVPKRSTPNLTTSTDSTFPAASADNLVAPQPATTSNNPFDQIAGSSAFGLSTGSPAAQANTASTNPWQNPNTYQASTGLEQSFQNMQVSQPSASYGTGGYAGQAQYFSQSSVPSVPAIPQQYAVSGSAINMNSSLAQAPLGTQPVNANPYALHMQNVQNTQNIPSPASSTNPFLNASGTSQPQPQQPASSQTFNPFGLPPSNSPPKAHSQPANQQSQSSIYDSQSTYTQPGLQPVPYGGGQYMPQQQFAQPVGPQSPSAMPNFQYAQPQAQFFQQQPVGSPVTSPTSFNPYVQQQQSPTSFQTQANPYFQQQQQQPPPHQMQLTQQQPQTQSIMPQATGLLDKNSILALYNHPQLAPNRAVDTSPQLSNEQSSAQQQRMSPAPSNAVYDGGNTVFGKRSATMPASATYSPSSTRSRNPFMSNPNVAGIQGSRHTSHESMAVNNPNLQDGRHSPDAFASLSATYGMR